MPRISRIWKLVSEGLLAPTDELYHWPEGGSTSIYVIPRVIALVARRQRRVSLKEECLSAIVSSYFMEDLLLQWWIWFARAKTIFSLDFGNQATEFHDSHQSYQKWHYV